MITIEAALGPILTRAWDYAETLNWRSSSPSDDRLVLVVGPLSIAK
jgi:hypothetical protein